MRFGNSLEKGIRLNGLLPEVVSVDEVGEENLLVHDEQAAEPTLAYLLSRMGPPDFPDAGRRVPCRRQTDLRRSP